MSDVDVFTVADKAVLDFIALAAPSFSDHTDPFDHEEHDYVSTACHHGLHERCRLTCKFCHEPCECKCHEETA